MTETKHDELVAAAVKLRDAYKDYEDALVVLAKARMDLASTEERWATFAKNPTEANPRRSCAEAAGFCEAREEEQRALKRAQIEEELVWTYVEVLLNRLREIQVATKGGTA